MNRKWYSIRTPAWKIRRRSFVYPSTCFIFTPSRSFYYWSSFSPSSLSFSSFPSPCSFFSCLSPCSFTTSSWNSICFPGTAFRAPSHRLKKILHLFSLLPSLSHRSFPKSSLTLSYLEPRGLRKMGCREERKGRILRMENSEQSPGLSTQTTSSLGHSLCLDLAPCLAQNTINIHLCGWLCVLISRVFLQMKSHKMK